MSQNSLYFLSRNFLGKMKSSYKWLHYSVDLGFLDSRWEDLRAREFALNENLVCDGNPQPLSISTTFIQY